MIKSDANNAKVVDNILQAANKHPNSRVAKLIHSVEEEKSQKNIVLLLIELAEHSEYSTDFGISLQYYLDLYEQLGKGRNIVLNEAGLLLLNSSKLYARRVDFVQELVERQILTLSNTEKEMVANSAENTTKTTTEKPKRTRKRLVEAIEDPYAVELLPRKFRKLTEEKRFVGFGAKDKPKVTSSKFYRIESEQYLHPAAWMHASMIDLENEEDIDSKRNYKLFTYHVEHRYNTLVPDINFRLHFKIKDYIDEEEERLAEVDEQNCNTPNVLSDWPPLSEEYIEKYLNLENRVLEIGEITKNRKKLRLDKRLIGQDVINNKLTVLNDVQISNPNLTNSILDVSTDVMQLDSGIADSCTSLNTTSANDLSTNTNESQLLDESGINSSARGTETDLSITDLTGPSLDLTQNLNSTEKSLLECSNEGESSIDASNISIQKELTDSEENGNSSSINDNGNSKITTLNNDTGLGESINEENPINASSNVNSQNTENPPEVADPEKQNKNQSVKANEKVVGDEKTKNSESEDSAAKIRVYLPHLDDEGVYFSDLDDQEQRMLSPKVLTTDVFPQIPNKENITIIVDDEIKNLLNIIEDEPPTTYTMPVQIMPPTPPLVLNILKFHEKILRRRLLFKLSEEMDLFLQSRSMKRTHNVDMVETRQYRPMKLFNDSADSSRDSSELMRCADAKGCNMLSDDEDAEDFLGFTEEEQASKISHRLSRDSGVDADVLLTLNTTTLYGMKVINEEFDKATQEIVVNGEKVDEESISQKNIEACPTESKENELTEKNTLVETLEASTENEVCGREIVVEPTETTATTKMTNENCTDKVSTDTPSSTTAAAENSPTEDVTCLVDNNTVNENDIDEAFSDTPIFFEDDMSNEESMLEIEKSKTKIQKWHEYLQPILSKARDRHHFDVFQLGTEIMNELQKPISSTKSLSPATITFQNVMNNKDESYVSRYFLSTLLLANQNNVKISVNNKSTEKPSTWDDIELNLLDTKRHTVAIEDNIGIMNSKAAPSYT